MPTTINELEPFQPLFDELAEARDIRSRYGSYRGNRESLEGRQNGINYELACAAEEEVVARVVDAINDPEQTTLSLPERAITAKVMAHDWRDPIPENLGLIQDGFDTFARVEEEAERNRGTVALVDSTSFKLFTSHGADDIKVNPLSYERGRHEIRLELSDGKQVGIQPAQETEFPDPMIIDAKYSVCLLPGGHGNRVAEMMGELDPTAKKYKQPFVRLGTPEKPGDNLDEHLPDDAARFAARLLIVHLSKQDWIQVTPPGEEVKARVIDELSNVYQDLLNGLTARDAVKHVRGDYSRFGGTTTVTTDTIRRTSLAAYEYPQRQQLLYAADVSPEEVELATQEKITKQSESSTSADGIIQSMRAQQFLKSFFAKLAEA